MSNGHSLFRMIFVSYLFQINCAYVVKVKIWLKILKIFLKTFLPLFFSSIVSFNYLKNHAVKG